ncbi:MAG: nicotinate-nicotinamide nucleotide adenylyltransferase [Rhodobacterales bacterium]|nr:nicotinate-nicotinamide nucleotide adenylyltransferase [Rhodobacterales bacterium]
MRIGIYGGSFNPPHLGHAMVTAWLLWADQVDEVWLLPTYKHAFSKHLADFEHRILMCEALAQEVSVDRIKICAVERELPSPSYMVDTLRHLALRHPEHRFQLVVGADVLAESDRGKEWSVIARRWAPIVVGRQGYPTPKGAIDFPGISSTAIRRALAVGQDVRHWVPRAVGDVLGDAYSSGVNAMKP